MARGDQLSRALRLIALLDGKVGRTLDQLRAELGVTKRTVQRDLEALQAAELPVISEVRDGALRWHFVEGFAAHSSVSFGLSEMMALYFSRGLCKPLQGTPVYEALQSAFNKIGASIPAQGLNFLKTMDDRISVTSFGWKDYSKSKETIQQLTKSVFHHQTVEIAYTASGHELPLTRKANPYKLWYVNNGLYLVGFDHRKQDIRVYAVERINKIAATNRRFEVPSDFVFEEFTKTAFQMVWGEPQTVKIRFSRIRHGSSRSERGTLHRKSLRQRTAGVILELSVGSLWEVKRWLIGWGAAAQVLEPKDLILDVIQEVNDLHQAYKRG